MNRCPIDMCREPSYDGDPFELCHHHTSRVRLWNCDGDHRYRPECYAAVSTSGRRRCVAICDECGHQNHQGIAKCDDNHMHRVIDDTRTGQDIPPCERCGAHTGVEEHHWAPRALFDDADLWPTSWLCPSCHLRWHQMTDTHRRRDAA